MKHYILLLFLVVATTSLSSQSTFSRVYYPPDEYNYGRGIVEVDSSFIVSVWRRQQFPEVVMLKLNNEGDVLIEKNYGNAEDTLGWFIHGNDEFNKINDSLFVLSGSIGRYEDGYYDVRYGHMRLFDSELDTIWTSLVRNDYDSTVYFSSASGYSETNDLYMCGQFYYAPSVLSYFNGATKTFITKFDLEGNIVWKKTYLFQNGFEAAKDIECFGDELITYGGQSHPEDFSILRKYNSDGLVLDSLGWSYQGNFTNLSVVRNNKFAFFLNFYPLQILKYNTELNEEFNYEYNISDGAQFPKDIEYDNSGNIITCGAGYDAEMDNFMGYIIKLDSLGDVIWNRRIFYYTEEVALQQFNAVIQTQDGGYAASGKINVAGGIHGQVWVVKTDSMGCVVPGCDSLDNWVDNLDEIMQEHWFTFGPNPIASQDGLLNIYLGQQAQTGIKSRALTFKFTNLQGQVVKEFEAKSFGTTYMIPLSGLAPGNYVLSLQNQHQVLQTSKLIVQ